MKNLGTYNFINATHPASVTDVICIHAKQVSYFYRNVYCFLGLKDFITISPVYAN